MWIPRTLSHSIHELKTYFPVVSLTGPRQSGKTSLLKQLFPEYAYVSLEDPDQLIRFQDDPKGFLHHYHEQVIFDEAQRAPALFSYLQTLVDEHRSPGRFILSGSQNFLLRKSIHQSLAGRVGVAKLFPLDLREQDAANVRKSEPAEAIYQGFYPGMIGSGIPARLFYPNYVATYVERDISGMISSGNLTTFQRFLQIAATYAGQLLNYSAISNAAGVSVPTIQNWFSILEESFILFRLTPYHVNVGKRLIKSPKLYFLDTGLLAYLLGMQTSHDVERYYQFGSLFENLVIANRYKQIFHKGEIPRLFFWRDSNGTEIDLLEEDHSGFKLIEIKANRTPGSTHIRSLERVESLLTRPVKKILVYTGEDPFMLKGVHVTPWWSDL